MDSKLFTKVILFLFFIIAMISSGSESKSVVSLESQIDCSSSNMTVNQLKAIASDMSCPDNDEQEFWEAACNCTVFDLPKSECPLCRISRQAEQPTSSSLESSSTESFRPFSRHPSEASEAIMDIRRGQNLTATTATGTYSSNDTNARLKLHNSSTIYDPSSNFIRFGK